MKSALVVLAIDIAILLVLSPMFIWFYVTYRRTIAFKIEDVKIRISRTHMNEDRKNAVDKLERLANLKYKGFPFPLVLATCMSAAGVLVALAKAALIPCGAGDVLQRCPMTALTAFAAAYIFSLFDVIRRHRRMEMTADSIHRAWHRMLAAPVLAVVLTPALAAPFAVPIAFGVGILPVNEVFSFVALQVRKRLGMSEPDAPFEGSNLNVLQGVDKDLVERLQNEGISTVHQLAFADTLSIFLGVNIDWKTLIDHTDQAILHNYVGQALPELRRLGIRGAIEVAELSDSLLSHNAVVHANARSVLAELAATLKKSEASVLNLIQTIAFDGQAELLTSLWADSFGESGPEVDVPEDQWTMSVSLSDQLPPPAADLRTVGRPAGEVSASAVIGGVGAGGIAAPPGDVQAADVAVAP